MSRNVKNGVPALIGFLFFILVASMVVVGGIFLATGTNDHGWSVPRQTYSSSTSSTTVQLRGLPNLDLTGVWESDNPSARFVASIANKTIDIDLETSQGSLAYWTGSFNNPTTETAKISSTPDPTKLMWSNAATKDFTFINDTLVFEYMGAGFTDTIVLRRR